MSLWVLSETLHRSARGVVGAVVNPPCTSLWVLSETLLRRWIALLGRAKLYARRRAHRTHRRFDGGATSHDGGAVHGGMDWRSTKRVKASAGFWHWRCGCGSGVLLQWTGPGSVPGVTAAARGVCVSRYADSAEVPGGWRGGGLGFAVGGHGLPCGGPRGIGNIGGRWWCSFGIFSVGAVGLARWGRHRRHWR